MASDAPLAALSLLLVSLYIALSALGCRYWKYLVAMPGPSRCARIPPRHGSGPCVQRYPRGLMHGRPQMQKNMSAPAADPRWTLALVDHTTGFRHNLDLDQRE